ncbi:hypothetical protein OHA10_23090 [Kribbella sp. NBC_00662]|uniref:hypothetical protein n=1 Tax=Kribbella sp. NBC_00662 TaxID=2975969 RepID=UPI003250B2D1
MNLADDPDYRIVLPRELVRRELQDLTDNVATYSDWADRVELLLEEAFAGGAAKNRFSALRKRAAASDPFVEFGSSATSDGPLRFLASLLASLDSLRAATQRSPYWSERLANGSKATITVDAAARRYVQLVTDLVERGYLVSAFDFYCVDGPPTVEPSDILAEELGVPSLWPLDAAYLAADQNTFFDVIEVLNDRVSRPRSRWFHSYNGCGWHYADFSPAEGRLVYQAMVNGLLEKTALGVRLATDGEDAGRLVVGTDDARSDLTHRMATREDAETGDIVRHALSMFRQRGATEHHKRSAAIALAGVLERRRGLLKTSLLRKDEGALFQIANEFAVRHQRADQKDDYDPVFLDWVFYWYLATVELTDRILDRQASDGDTSA